MVDVRQLLRRYLDLDTHGADVGLLILRVAMSAMMLAGHGWGKLVAYGERASSFPDPLGVGSDLSMALAIFAEVFCPLMIAVGLFTRVFAIPIVFTMLIAALIVHADDPWGKKELALTYAVSFGALLFTGAGRYALDAALRRRLTSG